MRPRLSLGQFFPAYEPWTYPVMDPRIDKSILMSSCLGTGGRHVLKDLATAFFADESAPEALMVDSVRKSDWAKFPRGDYSDSEDCTEQAALEHRLAPWEMPRDQARQVHLPG